MRTLGLGVAKSVESVFFIHVRNLNYIKFSCSGKKTGFLSVHLSEFFLPLHEIVYQKISESMKKIVLFATWVAMGLSAVAQTADPVIMKINGNSSTLILEWMRRHPQSVSC